MLVPNKIIMSDTMKDSSAKLHSLQKKNSEISVYSSNSETDFDKIRQYVEEANEVCLIEIFF